MTPEKAKEPVEKFRSQVAAIAALLGAMETYHIRDLNSREYVVNVKRHDDLVNLEEVVELVEKRTSKALSQDAKVWLQDNVGMTWIWESWLEVEREYVTQGLFGGMNLSSDDYWEEIRQVVTQGKTVNFPAIDELGTVEKRLALVDQWQQRDALDRDYLQLLNRFEPGWCGRNVGYFYLAGAYEELDEYQFDIQERFDSLDEAVSSLVEIDIKPRTEVTREWVSDENAEQFYLEKMEELTTLVQEYDNLATAVLWFMKLVEDYNKALDFQAEVVMWVEDALDDAKHHGVLIYQNEVEVQISTQQEFDKWGGMLRRHNDNEGNFLSLLFYPEVSYKGTVAQPVFLELPDEQVLEFGKWLAEKREDCRVHDRRRQTAETEDDAAREGY